MADTTSSDWSAARGEKWRNQLLGMEGMLRPIEAPLIAALELERPYRIGDLACGGGGTTLEVLRRAPTGSVVHGFDISSGLIEAARARAGASGVLFDVADIATAAPASPYDRLVSRFGIMFFTDAPAAFANLTRWLTPTGRFAFAVWASPADNTWMTTVREVVERFIAVPANDPEAPGPFRYADPNKLVVLLERAGFDEIVVGDWRGAVPVGGGLVPAEAASFAFAAFSSFGELLTVAGPDVLSRARESLTEVLAQHQRDGAVWMDARIHIVTGTLRPR